MDLQRMKQKELAVLLRVTPRQVHNLVKEGMPSTVDGKVRYYDAPECVAWYLTRGRQTDDLDELDAAKVRVDSLKGDLLELELAEKRRQLMSTDQYERVMADTLARVNARLLNLSQRIAAVSWSVDMTERERQARPLVDEIRAELYASDDVPAEDEATTAEAA